MDRTNRGDETTLNAQMSFAGPDWTCGSARARHQSSRGTVNELAARVHSPESGVSEPESTALAPAYPVADTVERIARLERCELEITVVPAIDAEYPIESIRATLARLEVMEAIRARSRRTRSKR